MLSDQAGTAQQTTLPDPLRFSMITMVPVMSYSSKGDASYSSHLRQVVCLGSRM